MWGSEAVHVYLTCCVGYDRALRVKGHFVHGQRTVPNADQHQLSGDDLGAAFVSMCMYMCMCVCMCVCVCVCKP